MMKARDDLKRKMAKAPKPMSPLAAYAASDKTGGFEAKGRKQPRRK